MAMADRNRNRRVAAPLLYATFLVEEDGELSTRNNFADYREGWDGTVRLRLGNWELTARRVPLALPEQLNPYVAGRDYWLGQEGVG